MTPEPAVPVISAGEWKRKAVHVGVGCFALLLRWLPWPLAALCALLALLFSLFVIPSVGRELYRDPAQKRDPGIVAYPAMVLLLILLFRHHLEIAAAIWGMMALGDPAASLCGKFLGGPRLPWNRDKRWSGMLGYFIYGSAAAIFLYQWVWAPGRVGAADILGVILPAVALAAFLESLHTGIDDNWVPAIPAGLFLYAGMYSLSYWWQAALPEKLWIAVLVNIVIAVIAGFLRIVKPSGAVAGAVVGTLILAFGGWNFYAILWAFFLAGTISTRWGFARKSRAGVAQKAGGRRGVEHVVANCGVGLFLCLLFYLEFNAALPILALAFVASFAAALADTCGTEFGSLYGKRAFSLTRWRAVVPGTKGAVSLPGSFAGLAGAALLGVLAAALRMIPWSSVAIVAAAGLVGSLAESLLLDLCSRRGLSPDHEFVNAFNTFVGVVAALEIALSLGLGRLYIPIEAAFKGML